MCFYQWLIVEWVSQNIILYHTYPHILFWNLYFTAGIHAGMHVLYILLLWIYVSVCSDLDHYMLVCIYTCSYVLTFIIKSIFPPAVRKFFLQWVFLSLSLLPRLFEFVFWRGNNPNGVKASPHCSDPRSPDNSDEVFAHIDELRLPNVTLPYLIQFSLQPKVVNFKKSRRSVLPIFSNFLV